ncbi:MAG: MoaD/ThiS family protein [Planctomycetes bacterium]|nr:MoaD/ThiS family protein [Planctomycetota bacterium]
MKIAVLLFAGLREATGESRVELELGDGATVGDAQAELLRRFPALRERRYAFALDHHYATAATALGSARELALIPPVSGG